MTGNHNDIYTPEEMTNGLRIQPHIGNGCPFVELSEKIGVELAKALEKRQKFKDKNNALRGDHNKHMRKHHRQDLGY